MPTMLMTPNMRPLRERRVRYEPSALPSTGEMADWAARRECMALIEPILGEVAYTVKMKVRMMAKRTVVWVLWFRWVG